MRGLFGWLVGAGMLAAGPALAETTTAIKPEVVVTATRLPVAAERLPAMITRIDRDVLDARGAGDLRRAVSLVSGVEAPPGGDAGPASAVPSFWGLHEFDAFLLVVDGVPWGGAFNPAIDSLDFNNLDHVEVLKGAAPVPFGQTAFVGVIQLVHSPAGEAKQHVSVSAGEHGSYAGSGALNLTPLGDFKQSVSLSVEDQRFDDRFARVRDVRSLYRLAGPLAGGTLRFDLDATIRRDHPQSPTVREDGAGLTHATALDGNFNPADGRLNQDRMHGTLAYDQPTPLGIWSSAASLAYTQIRDVRGFLRASLTDTGAANADYQNEHRRILDFYSDTHLAFDGPFGGTLLAGADALYGLGQQVSRNGDYYVPLNGRTRAPATTTLAVDETNGLRDSRLFTGQYLQYDWSPQGPFSVVAGLHLNETAERKHSTHIDTANPGADEGESARRGGVRLTGQIGASWRFWSSGADKAILFADYRNTGQPGAIDFGPDFRPDVLKSERAASYEFGVKGGGLGGRLSYEVAAFQMDFKNLVVATTNAVGAPVLENAGAERLRGVEAAARYHASRNLDLYLSGSVHDAVFTSFITDLGGATFDVSGNNLTLSPKVLAAVGMVYAPPQGLGGSLVFNWSNRRFLDLQNEVKTPAYATLDTSLSYRIDAYRVTVQGTNLSDRRDAASSSEFGDQSFYRLPGRKIMVGLDMSF